MQNIDKAVLDRASQAWQEACRNLQVNAVAPFFLGTGRESVSCLAFLPDFGGANGMVIAAMDLPEIKPDDKLKSLAEDKGIFCSFVNASAFANRTVSEKVFKEALEDWGYYGPRADRPVWFAGYDHSQS